METKQFSNYNETEEGEILSDDPAELYVPLERPHISNTKPVASTSFPSIESDDESALKESSSDSDSSVRNSSSSKIRKVILGKTKSHAGKKKKYNIWSSDIQTEVLTNFLVDCNVDQNNDRWRNVETYNYKLKSLDNDNESKNQFLATNKNINRNHLSVKRKHNGSYVDRIDNSKSTINPNKSIQSNKRNILGLSTNVNSSEEDIARDVANKLCETKEDLILKALHVLGKKFVISLFEETKSIEASGGMMVMNGTRRRTPGGVFFYLLKTSEDVPREKINLVLSVDKKVRADEKKLKSKINRQLQAEKLKKSLSKDDFPTLLSRTELEIKKFKARQLEDSAEVKNPPPSPATDGKECSSDGEEQKEVNDRKLYADQTLTVYDCSIFGNDECDMDVF